jgi:hypothetical protein
MKSVFTPSQKPLHEFEKRCCQTLLWIDAALFALPLFVLIFSTLSLMLLVDASYFIGTLGLAITCF